jgi:flagellar protein FlaG
VVSPVSGRLGPPDAGGEAAPRPAVVRVSAPVEQQQAPEAKKQAPDSAQLHEAVQRAEQAVRQFASNLRFSLDKETGKTVIKIVDSQTNEVIRQIPSEELLAISRNLDRVEGLLLKQQA